jgi:uncharacterized protein (DUF433 family)/DNA-binding transcriptional MerR regulator
LKSKGVDQFMPLDRTELWRTRLELPAYRVGEAASYAKISPQTIASWEKTYNHKPSVVSRRSKREGLSFLQLIEVAIVAAMRKEGVKIDRIRSARDYFSKTLDSAYPFAQARFKTDGVDILLDFEGPDSGVLKDRLLVANANGQLIWTEVLQRTLKEFNYDPNGGVIAWLVNGVNSEIVIDPKISFGSPTIHGIMTRAIKNEWALGQAVDAIADDFEIQPSQVIEALEFEGMNVEEEKSRWLH